jgi:26S proteasome regulatory subunit N5
MPEAKTFAAKGKLNKAFEMFALEKQTRSGADTHSTGRVLVTIVQLCFEAKEWNQLNEKIIDLVKKRAQLKQMVSECCTFLDK